MPQPSHIHRVALCACLLLPLLISSSAAAAEPAPKATAASADKGAEQSAVYREAIAQALNEYELAHYEEARTLFAKAHSIAPSARTWRGLGMAEFELRNYIASIDDLEQALRHPVRPLSGELRSDTEALLARAREFVTQVELTLQPSTASLSVDGALADRRADGGLTLPVGEHVLEVSAPGYMSERRKLSLVGGRTERVQIILAQESAAVPVHSSAPADTPSRPLYKNPWLWVGVGVVVAGAVALGVGLSLREEPETKPIQGSPEVGGGLVHTLRFGR
ncbi:MAG TPA: carboxypeptidase-like regulatory domain-containing protein [Polyangiales bacterium]